MRPLKGKVVVEQKELKTEEGWANKFVPDNLKEKPQTGVVVATPLGGNQLLSVEDKVVFGKYSGTEFEWEGKKYLILREDEILVVL